MINGLKWFETTEVPAHPSETVKPLEKEVKNLVPSIQQRFGLLSISYNMIDLAGVISCEFTVKHMELLARIIKYSSKQRIEYPLVHHANQNKTDFLNCHEQQKQRYSHMQL